MVRASGYCTSVALYFSVSLFIYFFLEVNTRPHMRQNALINHLTLFVFEKYTVISTASRVLWQRFVK